jgi:uncharacterized membrane protein
MDIMFGRTILGVLAVIALVALVAVIGNSVYNAGISQGLAEAASAAAASGDPVPVVYPPYAGGHYGWGYGGWGFGFFGIIFWILGFFLIVGLLRAAFGWGRWGSGGSGRGGWESRNERISELHRELHRREDQTPGSAG